MTEGTEDAETQEPSIYKDFGQKVRRVRPQGRETRTEVQQALIEALNHQKTLETCGFQGFFFRYLG